MAEQLLPDGSQVAIAGIEISAQGLSGQVEVHLPGGGTMRGAEDTREVLLDGFAAAGFFEQLTVEISDPQEQAAYAPPSTRGPGGSPESGAELALTVPGPGDGFGQVVLACDEDGVLTWHFPEDVLPTEVVSRAADRRTYRLRTRVVGAPIPGKRGLMGALGKKLLKVLAFKVVDKALGAIGDFFVSRWEKEHRPHRLRSFTPGDYQRSGGATLGATELANLAGGPALMFIHGTASQGHKAFGAIPETALAKLHSRYQGRVFAFEHPTLSVSPTDNVRWLSKELSRLPASGSGLNLDIVAHSRGGLVGRTLCEQPAAAGLDPQHLRVRQLLMVATPNAGTPLGDRAHLNTFVDTLTNLLEFIPDNPATDTLEVVLTLLKQLAVGAMGGLDGLLSMDPKGDFLRNFLNRPSAVTATYRALAANFDPPPGTPLGRYARDP